MSRSADCNVSPDSQGVSPIQKHDVVPAASNVASTPSPSTGALVCRIILWVLIVFAWLLYLVPGFLFKDAQTSEDLPVQGQIQLALAGKLMRLQDTGMMPPQMMGQVDLQAFLGDLAQEYDHHPYLTICQALERLHRGDDKRALQLLESQPAPERKWEALYNATLTVARARCAGIPVPRGSFGQALIIQESVQSDLSDYFQKIARHQLAEPALWAPSLDVLTSDDVKAARRDIVFLSSLAAVALANVLLVLLFAVWLVSRRFHPSIPQLPTRLNTVLWHGDPLRVCGAYVLMQWLMMICVICLAQVFVFKSSRVLSVFCTYLCAYTLLIAAIAWLLPRLEKRTEALHPGTNPAGQMAEDSSAMETAEDSPTMAMAGDGLSGNPGEGSLAVNSLSVAQRLQWHRPRWRDILWGWLGFALTMVSGSLVSQICERISGQAPYSVNPFLDVVAKSQPGEWVLLIVELAVLGPIFEEILFRGLLFGGLRGSLGAWGAALVSAAVFGLTHIDPQGTFVLVGMGLCFAFVYHKSGNLWSSIIAHGLWNGFVASSILYMS